MTLKQQLPELNDHQWALLQRVLADKLFLTARQIKHLQELVDGNN